MSLMSIDALLPSLSFEGEKGDVVWFRVERGIFVEIAFIIFLLRLMGREITLRCDGPLGWCVFEVPHPSHLKNTA